MVSDFAFRLSAGLGLALLVSPWRLIPPAYYRTMSLVLLALAILAAVDTGWTRGPHLSLLAAVLVALFAYAASVLWGLGLAPIGMPLFNAIAITSTLVIIGAGLELTSGNPTHNLLLCASHLSSGLVMGSVLAAMLLGHHYLTAPAMAIEPLDRAIVLSAAALAARSVFAVVGLVLAVHSGAAAKLPVLLASRWIAGVAAPALALFLAWRTARIRSTQSATGILYAATILVLLGELAAQGLARLYGIPF
jgi:hypothetical protein